MKELSKIDTKLLLELDINSRKSFNQIARKINSSAQAIKYKVNSFIKQGIINQFYTIINFKQLGFSGYYKVYIRLKDANQDKQEKILERLSKNSSIIWIASCGGKWDITLSMYSKDMADFDNRLLLIKKDCLNYLKDIKIISVIEFFHFPRKYLTDKKINLELSVMKHLQEYTLDNTDKEILFILSKNSRTSVLEIAKKTNLSSNAISQRIKKLIKNDIIHQFSVLLNTKKLNYYTSKILIQLNESSEQRLTEFKYYCLNHKNIVFYSRCFGEWNCEIETEVKNREEFYGIIMDMRNKFPDLINDYDFVDYLREYKYDFYPF